MLKINSPPKITIKTIKIAVIILIINPTANRREGDTGVVETLLRYPISLSLTRVFGKEIAIVMNPITIIVGIYKSRTV